MQTALFDQRVSDRWQRRGGTNPPKRSGRYTKPGPRPRARRKTEPKPEAKPTVNDVNQTFHVVYSDQTHGLRQAVTYNPSQGILYNPIIYDNSGWTDSTTTTTGSGVYDIHPYIQTSPYTLVTNEVTYGTSATDVNADDIIINPTIQVVPSTGSPWISADNSINFETNVQFPDLGSVPHSAETGWITLEPFTYTPAAQGPWVHLDRRLRHQQRLREQMRSQPVSCRADRVDFSRCTPAELTALSLLKKMVSEPAWRTYLKYGFISVRGKSGLDYQIRRGHWHVLVRSQGQRVAELCVGLYSRWQMPPTDEVIARMVMAECDEKELWRRANVDIVAERKRYHSNPQNHEHLERIAAVA